MLSILRKTQEVAMHAVDLSKRFSVEVFNDNQPLDQSPWLSIGCYERLADANDACKAVIDRFLDSRSMQSFTKESMTLEFLLYGNMPVIIDARYQDHFDAYEYLAIRCAEIDAHQEKKCPTKLLGKPQPFKRMNN